MKYFSEITKKLYNSEAELLKAEEIVKQEEEKKLAKEKMEKQIRAEKAKEVEKALKEATDAQSKAIKLLKEFNKTYGAFHMSYSNDETKDLKTDKSSNSFSDLLNIFFNV